MDRNFFVRKKKILSQHLMKSDFNNLKLHFEWTAPSSESVADSLV